MKVSILIKVLLVGHQVAILPFKDGDLEDCQDRINDRTMMIAELSTPSAAAQLSNVDADVYDFTFACVEQDSAAADAGKSFGN